MTYETTTHRLNLTGGQISTILYIIEGYICNSDDTNDEQFNEDVDMIFAELQSVTDNYFAQKEEFNANDVQDCVAHNVDYKECVDHLVDSMEASE